MSSWVRYCIAVYVGLLMSGALARPGWTQYPQARPLPAPTTYDYKDKTPRHRALPEDEQPADDRQT